MLTPFAFTMLMLKHQYPQEWQSVGKNSADATTGNTFETYLLKERRSLQQIALAFFSPIERQTFRFD